MNTKVTPCPIDIPHYDPRLMEYMTYANQITEPAPQYDPDVGWEVERKFFYISSSMRDVSLYPDPASFQIKLLEPLRNVLSVQLFSGVLPNQGGVATDPYLLLDVEELNHIRGADGSKYFGILALFRHYNNDYVNLDKTNTDGAPAIFRPALNRLDTLTIQFYHPDGTTISFGTESPSNPIDMTLQCELTFCVQVKVRKRTGIERDHNAMPVYHPQPMPTYRTTPTQQK